ncbi:MAG: hypothetical protein INH41_06960 [Myxococcaceae bacterium]|nr:hypothetical protein [Myxococcaceae bacterium]
MRPGPALLFLCLLLSCRTALENERCSASLACGRGLSCCDGVCVDVTRDARHCGACGQACGSANATVACLEGACRASCDEGFADCNARPDDGCEVDLRADVSHCGACRAACRLPDATPACQGGRCAVARCREGFGSCDGLAMTGCEIDLTTDPANCGACGVACARPRAEGRCVGGRCALGACAVGHGDCDGRADTGCEAQLSTSPQHCGACGHPCGPGTACDDGACRPTELYVYGGLASPSSSEPSGRVMRLVVGQRSFTEVTVEGDAGAPAPRAHHVAAWDGRAQRMLVFGGEGPGLPGGDAALWALEVSDAGVRWDVLAPTGPAPSPLRGIASGWDAARRRWYLFGGTTDAPSGTPSAQLVVLDADALAWSAPRAVGPSPPARAFAAAMVDPATGRFVVHGGEDGAGATLAEAWVFDPLASTWSQVPQSGPGPRVGHAFFEGASPPLLFGGTPDRAGVPLELRDDLWELDVAAGAWTRHAFAGGPRARRDARGVAVAGLRHLVSGNGLDATLGEVAFNDVWTLTWPERTPQQVRSNATAGAAGVSSGFTVVSREAR